LIFELGQGQGRDAADIMKDAGFNDIRVLKDLANIERVILGNL